MGVNGFQNQQWQEIGFPKIHGTGWGVCGAALLVSLVAVSLKTAAMPQDFEKSNVRLRTFDAKGVVTELELSRNHITIRHDAITDYMPAMTMSFRVKDPNEMTKLRAGDQVNFRLSVTESESWIDRLS